MSNDLDVINRIREFNRFYTVIFGMLNRRFLDPGYSMTECRILFELNAGDSCSASLLTEKLHVDKSHMSRILKSFEQKGLMTKRASAEDGRAYLISLTEKGKAETDRLINLANGQIMPMIESLSTDERTELCEAMDLITQYLGNNIQEA